MQHREIVKPFVYEKISLEEVREEERAKRRSASDSWGTIKRVWGYLAEKKLFLGLVLFMFLISSAMSLLGPYLVAFSIDEFIEHKQVDCLLLLLIILGIVYLFHSLSVFLHNFWMVGIAQDTVFRIRRDLFSQFHKLPIDRKSVV